MATDYKNINIKSRIDLRSIRDQRGDKTHFVYELIQNADDSKSKLLELHLYEKELLVWNDGCKFREEDVLRISSIGFSDKDLTQIGNFGTGFKAVYNYTDRPEVYSGDERFCLPDPTGISKTLADLASSSLVEGIDKVPPMIAKLVEEGKTAFRLPFRENLRQEDLTLLKSQLRELLKKRSLLFLPHLEMIQWHDICDEQIGTYHRCPYGKIQSANQVELRASMNNEDPELERFLVFSKKFQPRPDVIDELLQIEYDAERRKRIQETGEKPQPIEVAFKLQDGKITAMDNCVLFAYLPTEKETHLRFFIQARYQTNPARNDIEKTEQNPWNRWLVEETADFLPEILEQLKSGGLLEPAFFNVLPLKGEVENEFKPIAEVLSRAMRERAFVPTEKEGHYAQAENVFYPDSKDLRELVKSSGMHPDSSLLHPDIQESGRCFKVMAEAGIKKIGKSDLLFWLEKQSYDWFKNRTHKWMRSLYAYFNKKWSPTELERIKKLPLIRLENREHVCTSDQLVCFPPDTEEERQEIGPFLNELHILQSTLLKGEDHNDIKDFLDDIGVEVLHPEKLINQSICPLYSQPNKPSIMKNRRHVRYIFESWQKAEEYERSELEESISEVPILRAYKGIQRADSDFVVPCNAHLPQAYTGNDNLETYFSVSNGYFWFVDDKYLTGKSDTEAWFQFLKAIGAMDTPRVIGKKISRTSGDYKNYQEFNAELTKRNIELEYTTRWWETNIEDRYLQGLSEVLNKVRKYGEVDLSRTIWQLLVKIVSSLPSETWNQNTFFMNRFQGIYRWFYRTNQRKFFDAAFYRQFKSVAWIPDEQGNFHVPSKCFTPTNDNREVLGDSVPYLHPDFDVSTRPARWLAEKLGMHLQADVDGVLNYLQTLRGPEASIEKVEPIYKFLELEDAHLQRFGEEPLIFTPEPEPCWWRTDKVFWEDESAVFGDDRGYLKAHYSEDLKSFFTNSLEVRERADAVDYVRGIQDVASKGQAGTKEIRDRVQGLYRRLWLSLQESPDLLENEEWLTEWKQVREDACWLGRKGDEWGFFSTQELVWKDDDYRSELFRNEVPFWGFNNDLLELAKELGVKGCYTDSDIEFDCNRDQGEDLDKSAEVRDLGQNVRDFLNSPLLCGEHVEEKSTEVLDLLSVRRVERLEIGFELKGVSVPDPNPRQSYLEVTDQEATLWLASEANEDQYAWLIGDALQYYFDDIKELSAFVENLLTTDKETALTRWKQKGLQTNIYVPPPERDSKENEEGRAETVNDKLPNESNGESADTGTDESNVEIPSINETPEVNNEDANSTTTGSRISIYTPSRASGTSQPSGHSLSTSSSSGSGSGGHSEGGSGGESPEHRELKENLAANPFQLGEGLKLVRTEYMFTSLDKADILLEDSSENPVTVEVETGFSSGSGRYVGVWQAVKYQHLAAVEYGLLCDQVRSILAAPEIPDDVKDECERLGIEPIEVPD